MAVPRCNHGGASMQLDVPSDIDTDNDTPWKLPSYIGIT